MNNKWEISRFVSGLVLGKTWCHLWALSKSCEGKWLFWVTPFLKHKMVRGFLNLNIFWKPWAQVKCNIVRYRWKNNKQGRELDNHPVCLPHLHYQLTFCIEPLYPSTTLTSSPWNKSLDLAGHLSIQVPEFRLPISEKARNLAFPSISPFYHNNNQDWSLDPTQVWWVVFTYILSYRPNNKREDWETI